MTYTAIYVTFPKKDVAEEIIEKLLHEKLIACSNVFPIKSMYWWKQKINKDDEFVGLLKTSFANVEKVETRIKDLHPFEVPCIMRLDVSANKEYEDWVNHEVQ
ncbi:MAG: divalent-cation tolerance protein CutA [Candidatus Woesearchaeota archaeon]